MYHYTLKLRDRYVASLLVVIEGYEMMKRSSQKKKSGKMGLMVEALGVIDGSGCWCVCVFLLICICTDLEDRV